MVLGWTYFLILQTIVFVTFFLKRKDSDDFVLKIIFPTKIHFLIVNACIFLTCCFYNTERQLFCIPVNWAAIILIVFCLSFLAFPFLTRHAKFLGLIGAICGLGLFISVYIILFAGSEYLIFVAFNIPIILLLHFFLRFIRRKFHTNIFNALYLYPAVILTPFLLIFQLWVYFRSLQKNQKLLFIATPVLTLLISLVLTFQMNIIINKIAAAPDKEKELRQIIKNPINNYLTELILGAHWKYHTEICLFDGWRPPFHDPILVIAKKVLFPSKLFGEGTGISFYYVDPTLGIDTTSTLQLYKKLYPNNPTKFDCACAKHELLFGSD
jgi:hypothetical protein